VVGVDGLRDSPAQKAVYASDAYTLEKSLPGMVALPRSTEEVAGILRVCHHHKIPVVPRGAGTGLAGGSTTGGDALLLCLSRMNRVLDIDLANRRLRAEAGAININLTKAVAADGYQFAPDPSSQGASTIGGNIATNAGGPHTLKYGVTVNHILSLKAVLSDGEIIELSTNDAGYDLVGLVTGSEGTLAVVTEATVRLVRTADAVRTLLVICRTMDDATAMVSGIIGAGILPAALEMIDRTVMQSVEAAYKLGLPTDAEAVLLIEVDGPEAGIDRQAQRIATLCNELGAVRIESAKDAAERARLWTARKKSVGTLGRLAPSHATQDGVAPRTKLPQILRDIAAIGAKHNLRIANVFHAGDGNLHPIVLFDERDPEQVKRVIAAGGEILRTCVEAGGALTGEHGIGIEKRDFLGLVFSPDDLDTMAKVRAAFNPEGLLNPGKLLPMGGTCCPHLHRPDTEALLNLTKTRAAAV
jgi:glycolate oxidase